MRKFNSRLKQQGIGLLELMLALAIIAILIVMATRYFTKASDTQKVTVVQQEIAEIKHAANQLQSAGGKLESISSLDPYLTPNLVKNDHKGPYVGSSYAISGTNVVLEGGLSENNCKALLAKIQEPNVTCTGGTLTVPLN